MPTLEPWVRAGRMACYWWWGCSERRATNMGMRGFDGIGISRFDKTGAWHILRSQPHSRFGYAGGGYRRTHKVHLLRDQIVAKHAWHPEARMTRWMCGAYTFEGVLQPQAAEVCSKCLMVSQRRHTEPLPTKEK